MQSIKEQLKYQQMIADGSFRNDKPKTDEAAESKTDEQGVQDSPAKPASKKAPRKSGK